MRFTLRSGSDPIAEADGVMLRALGLPSGGVIRLGRTHVRVRPGTVDGSDLRVGPDALANSGDNLGASIDIARVLAPAASRVDVDGTSLSASALLGALHGRVVTVGDRVTIDDAEGTPTTVTVTGVEPGPVATVGPGTVADNGTKGAGTPGALDRISAAMLAGLGTEIDTLTGWFSMLASERMLEQAWSLPVAAGIFVEGPVGCGKAQLVAEAARRADTPVHEVDTSAIFKPEKLLDALAEAVNDATGPRVIFVDRIEAVVGSGSIAAFRSQSVAVLRWFLDAVADKGQVMCVIGTESMADLDPSIAHSPLLPRVLTVPPPDLARRERLFDAALAAVPHTELDHARLAALSSGFSGADILSAVLHAAAGVSADEATAGLDTDAVARAIRDTAPSLGSVSLGETTSFGFADVANLTDVKQRLTEAVIWPMTQPERFERLGIDPPKGILLFGPPGTGKTFVVKALAHEAGAAFFSVKGAELLDKFVGESERGVRDVFARARAGAPAIIFFDEFDALAPVRGSSTNSVTDSVVAALLTEIDGVGERGRVAVIAATNRRDLIDPALLRAGRFETHLHLDLPGEESRRALLEITDVSLGDDVDLDRLATMTDGFSFADLSGLLREAALVALRNDDDAMTVHWPNIVDALATIRAAAAP